MNRQTIILYLNLLVMGLFMAGLCIGCMPLIPAEAPLGATATPPGVLADCFPTADVRAWLDENGDGVWDEGELPLVGIKFELNPTAQNGSAISDEDGLAHIFAWSPGECLEMQVTAVSFIGYMLTTAQKLDYTSSNTEYLFGFRPAPVSVLIETDTATGVIFEAGATAEFIRWVGEPADSFWSPTAEDVESFETGLAAFLAGISDSQFGDTEQIIDRLPNYTRQYLGIVRGGEVLIYANFFCDSSAHDWQKTAVVVDDGGDCYFQVLYNVDAKTYLSLQINGES